MLIFPLKVAPILEAIIKGAIISLIRVGRVGVGGGGWGRGEEGVGGSDGLKKKEKTIQDPLLPEKKIARTRVNAAVCFVKTWKRQVRVAKKKKKKNGHENISPTSTPTHKIKWSVVKYCL